MVDMKYFQILSVICIYLSLPNVVLSDGPIKSGESFYNWIDLKWIDDTVALMLTEEGLVYRSEDVGQTWESLTSQLQFSTTPDYLPAFIYPSPVDKNLVYIRGDGPYSWTSKDKGKTWNTINPGIVLYNLDWHLTNSEWCLATDSGFSVYATKDFGVSWEVVAITAYTFTWGDAGTGNVPEQRIYLTMDDQSFKQMVYTDDWGTNYISMQSRIFSFFFLEKQIFAAVEVSGEKAMLEVSTDLGRDYKVFYEAKFPTGTDLENLHYAILDDYTGAVFIGIVHDLVSNWGTLFVSDSTGSRYSTSLRYIHQVNDRFDFIRIRSLDGIYIANRVKDYTKDNSDVVTVISYDNGNTWLSIQPPHFDSNNQPIQCSSCNLHLHSWSSNYAKRSFGTIYSSSHSIGLILANGNVGKSLSYELDEVNTYLSRDGGVTWKEIFKGPSQYKFGDHGGIIIIVPTATTTNKIYYSLDEVSTPLLSYQFTQSPVTVYGVSLEVASTVNKFVLLAHRQTGNDSVIGLDFSQIYSVTCADSDYEVWSPSNGFENCLLGRNTAYLRRIATSDCFSDMDDHVYNQTNCLCTEDDWECDYGYERSSNNMCEQADYINLNVYPPAYCPDGTQYFKTIGYRREAGNTCNEKNGGIDHSPIGPFDCPSASQARRGWIAAAVLVPFIVLVLVFAAVAIQSDKVREKLPFLKFLGTWKIGYSGVNSTPDSMLMEEEEEEREDFSIQAEEIEDQQLATLNDIKINNDSSSGSSNNKEKDLISIDDAVDKSKSKSTDDFDDFNPRGH